jgi:hypothetical protein
MYTAQPAFWIFPQSGAGLIELWGGSRAGDRATEPIEDICCEKIRGCGYTRSGTSLLNVRYAPITTKFRIAAKLRNGPEAELTLEQK